MLDGRVLEASQVEYKPFGKPPLQREVAGMQGFPALNSPHDLIQKCSMADSCCRNIATKLCATCRHRSLPGRACPALKPRQAAEPPLSPGSLLYVLYVLYLTRQAAEPPLSPSSLLYVLYVLYTLYARNLYYICYIGPYSTYSTYSKEPGESGCSAGWRVRAAFCMVFHRFSTGLLWPVRNAWLICQRLKARDLNSTGHGSCHDSQT